MSKFQYNPTCLMNDIVCICSYRSQVITFLPNNLRNVLFFALYANGHHLATAKSRVHFTQHLYETCDKLVGYYCTYLEHQIPDPLEISHLTLILCLFNGVSWKAVVAYRLIYLLFELFGQYLSGIALKRGSVTTVCLRTKNQTTGNGKQIFLVIYLAYGIHNHYSKTFLVYSVYKQSS